MGFFRQEYWSGLPFPPSGDFPTQRSIKLASPESPALADGFFTTEPPGKPPEGGNGNPLQYSCLKNPMDLQSKGLQRVRHD